MSDIRKYVELIESYERIDEISRGDAINTIDSFSYNIALHFMKLYYYPEHTAYNHWIVEIRNFIISIIKRTRKVKVKREHIYQALSQDVLSVQIRREMVNELHQEYGYVIIDMDEMYNVLETILKDVSVLIDKGETIGYNEINDIIDRCT